MTSYGTDYSEYIDQGGHYEIQNPSNHDFCQFFVDFKEFFIGGRLEYQNSMFSAAVS